MIERQPRERPVIRNDLEAVTQDPAGIGDDRALRNQNALGFGSRTRRILDIGRFFRAEGNKLGDRRRCVAQFLVAHHQLHARLFSRMSDMRRKVGSGNGCTRLGGPQHPGDPVDIGVHAADMHAVGHGAWNQSGILTAEEGFNEFRSGLGDEADPVATLQIEPGKPARHGNSALAQAAIRHDLGELPARGVEIETGNALGSIVEPLSEALEFGELLGKLLIGPRSPAQGRRFLLGCVWRLRFGALFVNLLGQSVLSPAINQLSCYQIAKARLAAHKIKWCFRMLPSPGITTGRG